MLDRMKHKLESRLSGEMSITLDADYITLMAKGKELKSLLMIRREWKSWLKTQHSETKIIASGLITSWLIDGEKRKQWQVLFSWAPKSLSTVTAAMKPKGTCSLEEKL